jgi:hypothetical protein
VYWQKQKKLLEKLLKRIEKNIKHIDECEVFEQ